mgnify:CR=1 FL=1
MVYLRIVTGGEVTGCFRKVNCFSFFKENFYIVNIFC